MEREKFDVFCVNTGKTIRVEGGESLLEIYEMAKPQLAHRPVCAYVNNKTEELRYRVYGPKDIEFLDITHPSGMRTYVRSLCFVMYKAIRDIVPGTRLRIEHSLSHGYYCLLDNPEALKPETIARIKERMAQIIAADIPFEKIECHTADAIEVFRAQGMLDKVELLQSTRQLYTQYHTLDGLADSYYSWLTPSTGYLQGFDLIKYNGGVLLVPPTPDDPTTPAPIEPQEKMLNAFKEYLTFNHIVGLSNIGDLNQVVENRQATDLIKVAEALHEKKISKIADDITRRYHEEGTRIVLISGPSSSGKTTFSKRLSIQLMTNLLKPVAISLDNYFVNREDTPRDETGDYDYESLYALDLDLFNKDLNRLDGTDAYLQFRDRQPRVPRQHPEARRGGRAHSRRHPRAESRPDASNRAAPEVPHLRFGPHHHLNRRPQLDTHGRQPAAAPHHPRLQIPRCLGPKHHSPLG
mgnify:CR=1 FL=1